MNSRLIKDFLIDVSHTPAAAAARAKIPENNSSAVGYIGWVGHSNLGDEAMFEAICTALRPNKILPLLPLPGEQLLEAIGLGAAKRCAAVILGGGTLINRFYLGLAKRVLSWNIPLCVAGTGVGSPGFGFSPERPRDLLKWAKVLSRSPFLGVRGPESERLLREAGLENIEVIGDPALAYTPDVMPPIRSRPRLVINLGPERNAAAGGVATVANEFAKGGRRSGGRFSRIGRRTLLAGLPPALRHTRDDD